MYNNAYHFITRQSVYLLIALIVCVVVACLDYRIWRDAPVITWLFYGAIIILLVSVFFLGRKINGSYRWISLGPVNMQPSEFAKLATVIVLAMWLDRAGWKVELKGIGLFGSGILIAGLAVPVMLEPDFGSTLVIGSVGAVIMVIAGVRVIHLLPIVLLGGGLVVYKVVTNPNRMARMAAYLGFDSDIGVNISSVAAKNASYQSDQALVALKNSCIWGAGLTQSLQKHKYLPEHHTDFIFAIGAEELGVIFSLGVILLFVIFFALSLHIAKSSTDRFGRLLAYGMAFIIFSQAIFNIGVVCEAFPTKGMALPFFSYGGTNLIASFFAVGTILSVGIHSRREKKRERLRKMLVR
jgi:cell division protein FtsW